MFNYIFGNRQQQQQQQQQQQEEQLQQEPVQQQQTTTVFRSEEMSDTSDNFNPAFYCPICMSLMEDPVIDQDGNTYERAAIEEWLRRTGKSPITRNHMDVSQLRPNRMVKDLIEEAKQGRTLPERREGENMLNQLGESKEEESKVADSLRPLGLDISTTSRIAINSEESKDDGSPCDEITLVATITSPPTDNRVATDVVCVVDCSGSMQIPAKNDAEDSGLTMLDIVKHAVKTIAKTLGSNDRIAIVAYSNVATTLLPLTAMNEQGRTRAFAAADSLKADGLTNLWDGLNSALEILSRSAAEGEGKNRSILLLTDGDPNIEPPRGTIPMMKRFKEANGGKYPGIVNTFAFGYNLNSVMMRGIAVEGGGMYSFIPDSGFVGTAFVNSLANTLSTVAVDARVLVELNNGTRSKTVLGQVDFETSSWGVTCYAGSVQSGATKSVALKIAVPRDQVSSSISVTLSYLPILAKANDPPISITVDLPGSYGDISGERKQEVDAQIFRVESISIIQDAISLGIDGKYTEGSEICENFATKLKDWLDNSSNKRSKAHQRIEGLYEDFTGQIKTAMSIDTYFKKWGQHYLPSLSCAHKLEQSNNFKDPGIQFYGGQLFENIRDFADDVYNRLPPPTPSVTRSIPYGVSSSSSSNRSSAPSYTPAPVSMASFNSRDAPCFHSDCNVLMHDLSLKKCRDIVKGDRVYGGDVIECIIRTEVNDNVTEFVTLSKNNQILKITPYHPVMINGKWKFPLELGSVKSEPCEAVYSFLLENRQKAIVIEGFPCLTLAHGILGDAVATHDFYGTENIVSTLKKCRGWENGKIKFSLRNGPITIRDITTDLVCDFAISNEV